MASDEQPNIDGLNSEDHLLRLLRDPRTREEGFRQLMHTNQERIYWHVRRFVFEHEDANDIVQNTFIKAFKGIYAFKGESKLYTWLHRIATNEAISWVKKKNARSTNSLEEEASGLANRLRADAFFEGDQIQLMLQQALNTLPDRQRLVFNMRYYEEMSYKEISAILKTSVGALKASYHHAVKKIERFLKDVEV